ncbi:MAG: hypothetical protein IKS20_13450 [Victivallales bacterium]|nr:hypothetical protein [Victivallales bacterium]
MMKYHKYLFLVLAYAFLILPSVAFSRRVPNEQKKIIHFGFVSPSTPDHVVMGALKNVDATCPFDGIGINPVIKLKRGGKTIIYNPLSQVGAPHLLAKEDFAELIPMFRKLKETRLKHNFYIINSSVFNCDWFDDEAWSRTLNNISMLAWAAKESGFEGICLDIEPYTLTKLPFMYRPFLGHSFEETSKQVRLRAMELTIELNRQFPDITIFTFYWASQCNSALKEARPELLVNSKTGLMVPFINGVYDAAPTTMKIIDGNEGPSYHAAEENDYAQIMGKYHRFASSWIDPANHEKFWKISSLGFSFYLDSYAKKDKPSTYNLYEKSDNPTQLLASNISHALDYTDEYVWIWCENGNFWPGVFKAKYPFWNEKIPYCVEAIEAGRNIHAAMEKYASKKNLLKNGSLEPGPSGQPNGPDLYDGGIRDWPAWQASDTPKGTMKSENGMLRLVNVTNGGISQGYFGGVKAGQHFILRARCKNESKYAMPVLSYFFRDNPDKGLWGQDSIAFTEEDKDGWKSATFYITVPDGHKIASLNVYVGVNGFQDPTGEDKGCLFDDVELHEVIFPWTSK